MTGYVHLEMPVSTGRVPRHTGERSSHAWFVLKHLLGVGSAKNYDGNWTELGNLVGAPIETAAGPTAIADVKCQ
jgi:hypothetical protein